MPNRDSVINDLNVAKLILCNPQMLTSEMCIRIGQSITSALDLLKEQKAERKRMISWLGKFCRHIDNGDKWLSDEENIAFFREKMKQQFGWDS